MPCTSTTGRGWAALGRQNQLLAPATVRGEISAWAMPPDRVPMGSGAAWALGRFSVVAHTSAIASDRTPDGATAGPARHAPFGR